MSGEGRLGEGEWRREARRALALLSRHETVLARTDAGAWGVYGPKNGWRRALCAVAAPVGERIVREDLVAQAPRGPFHPAGLGPPLYRLSANGQSFLRRGAGESFGNQHRSFERRQIDEGPVSRTLRINVAEAPLGWLRKRKNARGEPFLSDGEYEAGERLRADFAGAGLEPRVTPHWQLERVDTSVRTDYSGLGGGEAGDAARRRFWAAVDALGPELAPPVVAVCCFGQGLEAMERMTELPQRAGKTLLKFGLAALARHYGLVPRGSVRVRVAAMIKGAVMSGGGP